MLAFNPNPSRNTDLRRLSVNVGPIYSRLHSIPGCRTLRPQFSLTVDTPSDEDLNSVRQLNCLPPYLLSSRVYNFDSDCKLSTAGRTEQNHISLLNCTPIAVGASCCMLNPQKIFAVLKYLCNLFRARIISEALNTLWRIYYKRILWT